VQPELWTLIGVAAGAVLTFAAQWLLARLQRTDERSREAQAIQRDAYARFLSAVHRTLQAVTKFVANDPDEPVAFETLREANIELQDCIALIGLVAPRDTYFAASRLADATLLSRQGGTSSPANEAREHAASVEFMKLARRDIGTEALPVKKDE
jgi:hypothetical protein